MAESNWKSPALMISIITVSVALVGLYINFTANNRKAELDKLDIEAKQRQKDDDELNRQKITKGRQDKINLLYKQIDQKLDEIQTCDNLLRKSKIEMAETNYGRSDYDISEERRSSYNIRYDRAKEINHLNDSLRSKLIMQKDSLSQVMTALRDDN